MPHLGNLIKRLRGKETLRDAAKRIGVSHTYLSVLEKGIDPRTGKPIKPTAETLKLISLGYNYNYEELLQVAGILDPDESKESHELKYDHAINSRLKTLLDTLETLPEADRKRIIDQALTFAEGIKAQNRSTS